MTGLPQVPVVPHVTVHGAATNARMPRSVDPYPRLVARTFVEGWGLRIFTYAAIPTWHDEKQIGAVRVPGRIAGDGFISHPTGNPTGKAGRESRVLTPIVWRQPILMIVGINKPGDLKLLEII